MAKPKDAWTRFREKEEEREKELEEAQEKGGTLTSLGIHPSEKTSLEIKAGGSGKAEHPVFDLIKRAETLIDQVQNLYHMYATGVEKLPPLTQRKHLEDMAAKILAVPKTSASILFRVGAFNTKIQTYREKWEKLMRDIEVGKIKIQRQHPGKK